MQISFEMIISIILIIIFLAAAFYAITRFIGWQRLIQEGKFSEELQSDIDKIWKSSESSFTGKYSLPSKIKYVCFIDFAKSAKGAKATVFSELELESDADENMFFYPVGSSEGELGRKIEHINLKAVTNLNNPYCIENKGGVSVSMKIGYGENLVCLGENCVQTEENIGETSPTICLRAQQDGLCGRLNLDYNINYRTNCCKEHSLCC